MANRFLANTRMWLTRAGSRFLIFAAVSLFAACLLPLDGLRSAQQSQSPQQHAGQAASTQSAPRTGILLFYVNCTSCHGNPQVEGAPDPTAIKQMSPEKIYQALASGPMQPIAKDLNLTDEEMRRIAETMSGRKLGGTDLTSANALPNRCETKPPLRDPQSEPGWNGWGFDLANSRFEPGNVAKLTAGQISRLKVKWVFGVPNGADLYDQPTIVGGRIYLSSDTGTVYSLNAATGCVYWSFQAQTGVRSAMTVGPPEPGSQRQLVYFGDQHGNTYALNAFTGEQVWKIAIDASPVSQITGSPKLYKDRLYVPVTAFEEAYGADLDYTCCTFRGIVVALDAGTGKQIWKTYTIPDAPKLIRKSSLGKDYWGPAGAGVWDSPTIDPQRNALYIGTGNGYSEPQTKFSDAVMAMDLDTGKVLWSFQAIANDLGHAGCQHVTGPPATSPKPGMPNYPPENCPQKEGPDWDFAASPILTTLPNGMNILIAGQKSGDVWALDVDKGGALVWKQNVAKAPPTGGGEVLFGGAVDSHNAYFNLRSGGLVALDLMTGAEKWYVDFTPPPEKKVAFGPHGASAAVTVIPGAILSGDLDGILRALSPETGDLIWEFNTAKQYENTVDGVPAHGGSIGSAGPIVVDGTLYMTSGYMGIQRGIPGNAFLAFGPGD
jgi:polyvinyl alcohol dehydrogenase (cytochrome)